VLDEVDAARLGHGLLALFPLLTDDGLAQVNGDVLHPLTEQPVHELGPQQVGLGKVNAPLLAEDLRLHRFGLGL
jgi:hypothetical protein